MKIRKATKADVPKILPVWRELMELHRRLDSFYDCREGADRLFAKFISNNIREPNACVLVAEADGRVVGYCQGMISKHPPVLKIIEYGQILDFAVLQSWRRQGLGQQMLEKMFEWFWARGLLRIEVRCSLLNEISRSFWRKMGFEPYMETLFRRLPEQLDCRERN